VWEGARDDAETDAAIHAEHLVSFLDDGAIDILGTGTMRSLALTAAEDLHVPEPAADPAVAPGSGAKPTVIVSPASAATTTRSGPPSTTSSASSAASSGVPSAIRSDGNARSSPISSANSTFASGSFHTIPADGDISRIARPATERPARRLAPIISLVIVAVAAGGIVFWLTTSFRDRLPATTLPVSPAGPGTPVTGQVAGPPTTGQPDPNPGQPAGQPDPGQPNSGQPNAGQPNAGQPGADQEAAGPDTGQGPGSPSARGSGAGGRPGTGRSPAETSAGSRVTGRGDPARPSAGHPAAPPPGRNGASEPSPDSVAEAPGTGGAATGSAASGSAASGSAASGSAASGTCRVRINLTPWAYYTTDEDGTQRETPSTVDLTPGRHRIHVWNPQLRIERDIIINVPTDRDTMNFSEPLQPAHLAPDAGAL
jgi:hypothetical protein